MMQAYNAASAAFANTVLRAFFGVQPPLPFGKDANASAAVLASENSARGFNGVLSKLRFRGQNWDVVSDSKNGLRISLSRANGGSN
jgi:hypothetical protein